MNHVAGVSIPSLFSILFSLLLLASQADASPKHELLRLVPNDVTFCFVIQNLREKCHQIDASPLGKYFEKHPPEFMQTPEFQKILQEHEAFFKVLGITDEQLVNNICGDAIVFGFRHQQQGQKREDAFVLLWAKDAKLLGSLAEKFNQIQIEKKELKAVTPAKHNGQTYFVREKNEDGDKEHYFIQDNLLMFAPNEATLFQLMDQNQKMPTIQREKPWLSKRLDELNLTTATVVWWVNPRSFEKDFHDELQVAPPAKKKFLTHLLSYWKAIDDFAIYAKFDDTIEIGVSTQVRTKELPKPAQQFFSLIDQPSELWQAIPDHAMFALTNRLQGNAFIEMVSGFMDEATIATLKKSIEESMRRFGQASPTTVPDVFGPDWGFWIYPPSEKRKEGWFPNSVLALKLAKDDLGKKAGEEMIEGFRNLSKLLRLLLADVSLETVTDGKNEIYYLKSETHFPPNFQPACAFKDGYILVTTSPEAIKDFKIDPKKQLGNQETLLVRISFSTWKEYLTKHRAAILDYLAVLSGKQKEELEKELDEFLSNFQLADRLEIGERSQKNKAMIFIRIRFTLSLDK